MESSTALLVNPILGLMPKYTEEDFERFCEESTYESYKIYFRNHKRMFLSLANLLYKIELDDQDKNLLCKSFKRNKEFLTSIGMTKKEFTIEDLNMVEMALKHRYKLRDY